MKTSDWSGCLKPVPANKSVAAKSAALLSTCSLFWLHLYSPNSGLVCSGSKLHHWKNKSLLRRSWKGFCVGLRSLTGSEKVGMVLSHSWSVSSYSKWRLGIALVTNKIYSNIFLCNVYHNWCEGIVFSETCPCSKITQLDNVGHLIGLKIDSKWKWYLIRDSL